MATTDFPLDPYKVLGVNPNAQLLEIRSAHRKLILTCHPDKFEDPLIKEQKQKEFAQVQQAYELLRDLLKSARHGQKQRTLRRRKKYVDGYEYPFNKKQTQNYCGSIEQTYEDPIRLEELARRREPLLKYGRSSGLLIAHGRINNQETHAIPDTGAEYNIIDATFAVKIGLTVQYHGRGEGIPLRMANGKHIQTNGTVEANWCFSTLASKVDNGYKPSSLQKEGSWRLVFHVLNDSVYDIILGNGFLMKTETMSRFKNRLSRVPRPLNALSVLRVNLMGVLSQRVRGTLNHIVTLALPDSGSEPNLLSWEYVKWQQQLYWEFASLDEGDKRLIQFADGSLGRTEGSIVARWEFAPKKAGIKSPFAIQHLDVEFHVLHGCPYDAVLGQDVLEETDTFLEHQDAIEDVEANTRASAMNLVIFTGDKKIKREQVAGSNSNTGANVNRSLHDELQHRAAIDRQQRREHINSAQGSHQQQQFRNLGNFSQIHDGPSTAGSARSNVSIHTGPPSRDNGKATRDKPVEEGQKNPEAKFNGKRRIGIPVAG